MGSGRGWLAGGWPSTGTGLRASSDGVLATKSESKMLASSRVHACTRSMPSFVFIGHNVS